MPVEDLFGDRAESYARLRPTYPEALFEHLERLVAARDRAWDCGAGSGQTARGLARRFAAVIASDASVRQLSQAARADRVHRVVSAAEAAPLRDRSVDLVTVSAAAHWFDRPRFYVEVRRVARPGAVLAMWSYYQTRIAPGVDQALEHFAERVLGPWWDERIALNRGAYRDLDFPFERLPWPALEAEGHLRLEDLFAYMRTWSSSQAYARERGRDPVDEVRPDLERAWGDPETVRRVRWPLHGVAGRVAG